MGILAYFVLSNRPGEAGWLSAAVKEMVFVDVERSFASSRMGQLEFGAALRKPTVWYSP
jgi:hypothetical protein